jgi:hypothetical protein
MGTKDAGPRRNGKIYPDHRPHLKAFQSPRRRYGGGMKRLVPPAALLLAVLLAAPVSAVAADARKPEKAPPAPGVELATLATQVTGIAISPLLGVSTVGAYQYFKASTPEQKARLPWFANPLVWLGGFLMVGACAFKDSFGAVIPPGLKKPFDVLELAENKLSGLVATGAVIPTLVGMVSRYLGTTAAADPAPFAASGLAMVQLGAVDLSWLLNLLMIPLSVAVFLIVWVVSHAINVLILLSPWGAVDAVLKTARTAVLGLVTATAYIDPVVGVTLSAVIVVVAYLLAGWAFRLTVFGTVFTWDFLTVRRRRFAPDARENWVFMGTEVEDAPIRTYGRLARRDDGQLQLTHKPWLVLPARTTVLPSDGLAVGRGLFWPTVEYRDDGSDRTLLTLPPRYKGHEQTFANAYAIGELRDVGLRRGWAILKELLGFGVKKPATA